MPPPQITDSRVLPQNWELEQALLGGLLQDWRQLDDVLSVCSQEDFHRPSHQHLLRLMVRLGSSNGFDLPTVLDAVNGHPDPQHYGGLGYVANLPQHCPSTENLKFYGVRIRAHSLRRQLILAAQRIITSAQEGEEELTTMLAQAEEAIVRVTSQTPTATAWQTIGGVARTLIDVLEERQKKRAQALLEGRPPTIGLSTGLRDLDTLLQGLHPREFTVVAGRPGSGKAQPLDAKIHTPIGWKRMGDLQVGDEVTDPDGGVGVVEGVCPRGWREVCRVTLRSG